MVHLSFRKVLQSHHCSHFELFNVQTGVVFLYRTVLSNLEKKIVTIIKSNYSNPVYHFQAFGKLALACNHERSKSLLLSLKTSLAAEQLKSLFDSVECKTDLVSVRRLCVT